MAGDTYTRKYMMHPVRCDAGVLLRRAMCARARACVCWCVHSCIIRWCFFFCYIFHFSLPPTLSLRRKISRNTTGNRPKKSAGRKTKNYGSIIMTPCGLLKPARPVKKSKIHGKRQNRQTSNPQSLTRGKAGVASPPPFSILSFPV